MQPLDEGKTITWQPEFDSGQLSNWWSLYVATLRRSRYAAIAEDVASSLILKMMLRVRGGRRLVDCPKWLPRAFRQEALRIARQQSLGSRASNLDLGTVPAFDPVDGDGPSDSGLMIALERVFTTSQIEKMVGQCRAGRTRRKDLARSIGISERTLRSRVREVRTMRPC